MNPLFMHCSPTRRGFLAAVGAVSMGSLAGCSAAIGGRSLERSAGTAGEAASPIDADGSAPPLADRPLVLPMAPSELRSRAVSGGVPKDGIPAIDVPRFERAAEADDRLAPADVVFGVAQRGVAKAYPQSILVWHEVCNDVVGGTPVSVTYCPLTGTAIAFERGGTTFGVSGRLVNDNLIMYDRATERWWPQVLATAISGWENGDESEVDGTEVNGAGTTDPVIGRSLRSVPVVWTTWGRWRERYPNTLVLTEGTGHIRDYGHDLYGSYTPRSGYYAPESEPLFPPFAGSDRYPPKTVVVGTRTPAGALSVHKGALRRKRVLTGDLDGVPHVAVYDDRLDTASVYRNPDGLAITPAPDGVRVGSTRGSSGTVHPPDALPLKRVHAFDAMWFAWSGFYPEARVRA